MELVIWQNLEILDASSDGTGIARQEGKVVFVEGAVPGDIVNARIFQNKKSFAKGRVVEIIRPSKDRVEPFCTHFGTCGGCTWQNMDYSTQLFFKEKQVKDAMERIGKIDSSFLMPVSGASQMMHYRNKLEYSFSSQRWKTADEINGGNAIKGPEALGFHIPGRFDKVLDLDECFLQPEPGNSIRLETKKYALANRLTFYDLRNHHGLLRNLIIRNTSTGEWMVCLVFGEKEEEKIKGLLFHLSGLFPEITSWLFVVNTKRNDTLFDQEVHVFKGKDHILENLDGLIFKINLKSFFQTNSLQTLTMYRTVKEWSSAGKQDIVYDLYTGTGTIACFMAGNAKKVIGVDFVSESIADAKENATRNNIQNVDFFAGDMKDILTTQFLETHGKPDVMIADPPRAGMHEKVIEKIIEAAPRQIIYVSCNPSTQARDLALLVPYFNIIKGMPLDMFPHTTHIENLVWLEKK